MKGRKLLKGLADGALDNAAFDDVTSLIGSFGFRLVRINGSHHILTHPAVKGLINLQTVKGEAKPYQVPPVPASIERYNLNLEK